MSDWAMLSQQSRVVALQYFVSDQSAVFDYFYCCSKAMNLPVYYWNPGYTALQQLQFEPSHQQIVLTSIAEISSSPDLLQKLIDQQRPGIYLIEGMIVSDEAAYNYQLFNLYRQSQWHPNQYWVLMASDVVLSPELQPLIPVLTHPLPDWDSIDRYLKDVVQARMQASPEQLDSLIRACQGLPIGEIRSTIKRQLVFEPSITALIAAILAHKIDKLRGREMEYIANPDVESAGGMDLLSRYLDRVSALFDPRSRSLGLRFPKGVILWGPPGTGKTLSAKLAAHKMGVPLLSADWGAILGTSNPDKTLRYMLQVAVSMAPVCFYFDDFEKAWDTGSNAARRAAGKLLTFMQEDPHPIFFMATVNRLGALPPELIRRFDDIFFVDLPNEGARYEVFHLQLSQYFPQFRDRNRSPWSDPQWRRLLTDYRICTPAEIANAVRGVVQEIWYQSHRSETLDLAHYDLEQLYRQLLMQRSDFTPSLIREEEAILEIRNKATFAKPSSSKDTSRFAIPPAELFD